MEVGLPGVAGRCGRHPAQLVTGVCSSCLVERLSSVRSPSHPEIVEVAATAAAQTEIVEVGTTGDSGEGGGSVSGAGEGKLRKTLMLLFQMDDSGGDAATASPPPEAAKDPGVFEVEPGGGGGGGARGNKWKRGSWLRSILPKRGMMRRGKKEEEEEPSRPRGEVSVDPDGGGDAQVERKASFRRSFEWMVCREPPSRGGSLEPPRHSWDGSMVGRAFACSFACLEEPPDGVTRVRQSNAEEAAGETRAAVAESRNGGHSADMSSGEVRRFGERSCGDTGPAMTVSGVGRRRSNRWSRVWDRSITSPLKEFVRKGEHVLDRSFSESRKETRRCNNGETADIDGEIQPGRNGLVSGRASQVASRSSQASANGDAQNFRTDWLKNKDCKIGRSRSVHYTSPGNMDNGMLRFYLTPMRSNRTANRGRRRSSRLFARGLFGFV